MKVMNIKSFLLESFGIESIGLLKNMNKI